MTAIDPGRMQAALDLSELPGLAATQDRQDFFGILEICIDRYEQERSIVDHAGDPDEREPPFSDAWDPRRAIVQWDRAGEKEEATWLAFLTTYFGYRDDGDRWQAVRTVYAGFGEGRLSWETVRTNRRALDVCVRHAEEYKTLAFGTFRNLEPHVPDHPNGFLAVVASYLKEVERRGHGSQVAMLSRWSTDRHLKFHHMVRELREIRRFGRLATFDFLTLLGNLGVFPLEPSTLHLDGSSSALAGARRLCGKPTGNAALLDKECTALAADLGVPLQVVEDALSMWQKRGRRSAPS